MTFQAIHKGSYGGIVLIRINADKVYLKNCSLGQAIIRDGSIVISSQEDMQNVSFCCYIKDSSYLAGTPFVEQKRKKELALKFE